MILPKSNISIMMVRNAIGYPSTDLGALCSAGEKYINKWSKYKPVHNNFTFNRPADWWRGTMRNCGINFLQHNTIAKLIASVDSGANQHPYESPSGGATSPYRLGDFAGYNTESIAPLIAGNVEGTYYKNNNNLGVNCLVRMAGEEELSITDIFGNQLDNMYYGAALQRNDSTIMWMSTSTPIAADSVGTISIPMSYLTAGATYYLYQFLSSYQKPNFTAGEEVGRFVALPGKQKQTIKIESSDILIALTNLRRSDTGVITGYIRLENNGSTRNYTNVSLQYRYGNSAPNDTFKVGEGIIQMENITVLTSETKTVPFTSKSNCLPDFNQLGGKVLLYMNNQLQAQAHILRESIN